MSTGRKIYWYTVAAAYSTAGLAWLAASFYEKGRAAGQARIAEERRTFYEKGRLSAMTASTKAPTNITTLFPKAVTS